MVNARDPGERNKRISIERNTRSSAGSGQATNSWNEVFKRWAKVQAVNGGESFKGHILLPEVNYVVYLPSDTDTRQITTKDRVKYSGRTLSILSAYDVEEAGVEVMLQCKEIQ